MRTDLLSCAALVLGSALGCSFAPLPQATTDDVAPPSAGPSAPAVPRAVPAGCAGPIDERPSSPSYAVMLERVVVVSAAEHGTNTGIFLRQGEAVTLGAKGSWSVDPKGRTTDAAGFEGAFGACPWGSLVAQVGLEYENATHHCIGRSASFVAERDGILFLYANDGRRDDNAGSVEVTIRSDAGTVVQSLPLEEIAQSSIRARPAHHGSSSTGRMSASPPRSPA